nr:flagellin lysine-N-methylase [uncultured Roseateles sp.]
MGKHSPVAAAPRYMQSFQCVGSACVENCCTGWRVLIDKPTFQHYRSVRIEPLAEKLNAQVQRLDAGGSGYAQIKMREDSSCPFLDESKLCQIHAQLGERALSRTCTDYPRQYSLDGGVQGLHAVLSCPEAARLALSDAQAMEPAQVTLDFANDKLMPVHKRRATPAGDEADVVRKHARLIAGAVEALIRFDGLSAVESMVVIGLMLRRIGRIASTGAQAELELAEAIEHYLSPGHLAAAPERVRGLPPHKANQLALLLSTNQRYSSQTAGRPTFRQLIGEVERGLHCDEGLEASGIHLQQAEQAFFRPFDAAHPHVLKNYLLNEIGLALFPSQGMAGLEREFMAIAVRFALVKLYACGLAAQRGTEFGLDDMVRVVYVVTRNISHNANFMPNLLDELAAQDALKLKVLTTLIL